MKVLVRTSTFTFLLFLLGLTQAIVAQTFRGGIAGIVQDGSGAVVSNAKISLTGSSTGLKRETVSTGAGMHVDPERVSNHFRDNPQMFAFCSSILSS
jgi:hypothetical protein